MFKKQLELTRPITENDFDLIERKYTSGRERKVGDILLFAFTMLENKSEDGMSIKMELISLHPDEFGTLYVVDDKYTPGRIIEDMEIPTLKLK